MTDSRAHDTEPPSMAGTVLGNYRIVEELSSGGMGTVYRAQHELLGRAAAVKLLRPELTANAELVQRFFNEAKAATAIRHPGIIEVFDFGYADDGRAYLVMEFLDGDSLAKRIADRGRLSEQEAAQITRGIASALTAAHKRGIVHRDLKPDNIFLVPDPDLPSGERPKVLDFGIAKLADPVPSSVRHTQTGALMGTPLYMAPEQARAAGEIDHRADLYSLGCILYELLVGTPPFVAEGAGEIIALQLFGQPEPPSSRLETISPQMEKIVMRLLEKEPNDRYPSAAELSQALAAMMGTLSTRLSAPLTAASSRPQITLTQRAGATPQASTEIRAMISSAGAGLDMAPPRRNLMPLIAGGITLAAIAGVVTVLIMSRGDDRPVATPPPEPVTPAPVVKQEPVPPPKPEVVEVPPAPPPPIEVKPSPVKVNNPPKHLVVVKKSPHVIAKPPVVEPHTAPASGSADIKTVDQKKYTPQGSPMEVNVDSKAP
jgi:serine/threonine protein kinase